MHVARGFSFFFSLSFFFCVSHIIKNKATNVLRRQICRDASLEGLHVDTLVQLVIWKCAAAVAPGLKRGVVAVSVSVPLAMPCLLLDAQLHHSACLTRGC